MAKRNNYTPDCPQVQAVRNALAGHPEGLCICAIGRVAGLGQAQVGFALSYMPDAAEDDDGRIFLLEARK